MNSSTTSKFALRFALLFALHGCGADDSGSSSSAIPPTSPSPTNQNACPDSTVYGHWILVSDNTKTLDLNSDCSEGNNTYSLGVAGYNKTLVFATPEQILFDSKNCTYTGFSISNNAFLTLTCDKGTFNYALHPVSPNPQGG